MLGEIVDCVQPQLSNPLAHLVHLAQVVTVQSALQALMVTVHHGLPDQVVGVHPVPMTSQAELRGKHLDYAQHALLDQTVGAHPVHQAQMGAQQALLHQTINVVLAAMCQQLIH